MTRRRRIIASLVGLFMIGGLAPAAALLPSLRTSNGPSTWACVAVDHVHVGACVRNPLYPIEQQGGVVGIVEKTLGG